MDINKKYYLELRELLGSEFVLGIYNDEEIMQKLIRLVSAGVGLKRRVKELEDEVDELRTEIAYLEEMIERGKY